MSVKITNVSDHERLTGINTYQVEIGGRIVATFDHVREEGLAALLLKASRAVFEAKVDEEFRAKLLRRKEGI